MARGLWRWGKRAALLLVLLIGGLLLPVGYVELACQRPTAENTYNSLLAPIHHRAESRSYLTYPEWHIVHAYDDYAQVIRTGDPHDYSYLRAITGFWSALCDLSETAADHGGVPFETKQMVYVIGTSFTAEMLAKAAYEETLGHIATWVRGPDHSPLDDLSAAQARAYAQFLQQVPWYQWDFTADAAALDAAATPRFRDRERRVALGLEYRAKAAYAKVIENAVAGVGQDALTLRLIASADPDIEGVRPIAQRPEGIELETPRYRALTHILVQMAASGIDFIEIAGNDDIMLTVISDAPDFPNARSTMKRQGYGDYRHIVGLKVTDLAAQLRLYAREGTHVEHIHDY
ncbi:MAG: hypothetical protein ACSHWZ_15930 [Sulfitobacter sp.]